MEKEEEKILRRRFAVVENEWGWRDGDFDWDKAFDTIEEAKNHILEIGSSGGTYRIKRIYKVASKQNYAQDHSR